MKINYSNGLSSSWIYIFCFQSPSEQSYVLCWMSGKELWVPFPVFPLTCTNCVNPCISESFSVKNLNFHKIIECFGLERALKNN